jgi:hypothetical protein
MSRQHMEQGSEVGDGSRTSPPPFISAEIVTKSTVSSSGVA